MAWIAWLSLSSAFADVSKYADIQSKLRELEAAYADQVKLVEIGANDAGIAIEGVAIGTGELKTLVVGTHHGNEYGSTEVAMAFAERLAENPIDGQTVTVIPVLNTTGFDKRRRWEVVNGRIHDPNRDYPGPCGTEGPFALKSTQALADFIDREGIVSSATLHTYYPAVVYPWGLSSDDLSTPYDDLFLELAKAAAEESGYSVGNSTEVIYPADGTFEDYAYWKHGVWSLLFELGFSHSPTAKEVEEMIRVNVPGLRRFLEAAPAERASNHEFEGACSAEKALLDRHDE